MTNFYQRMQAAREARESTLACEADWWRPFTCKIDEWKAAQK